MLNKIFQVIGISLICAPFFSQASNINEFSQDPWNGDVTERMRKSPSKTKIRKVPAQHIQNVKGGDSDEPRTKNDNPLYGLFTDGTFTLAALGTYVYGQPNNYWGYGTELFAQTGQIAGFSVGGNYMFVNPWFMGKINPFPPDEQNIFVPTNRVLAVSQAYLQYQFDDIFQANAGWLYINTPWLTSFNPVAVTQATFQGVLTNLQIGDHFLLTALAIDRYKGLPATNFSHETMYSYGLNTGTGTPTAGDSAGAVSVGLQYNPNADININGWGYIFFNYASMLYLDGGRTFHIDSKNALTFNLQGSLQSTLATGSNTIENNGYGAPDNQMLGAELIYAFQNYSFTVGYNALLGSASSFGQGGLISPYTYQIANDPLFTTSYIAGMVEKSGGQAVKITPAMTLLDDDLSLATSYAYYNTRDVPDSAEWDVIATYQVKQVQGLQLMFDYSILYTSEQPSGNAFSSLVQFMVTYLY
jgi:hypothetical protein